MERVAVGVRFDDSTFPPVVSEHCFMAFLGLYLCGPPLYSTPVIALVNVDILQWKAIAISARESVSSKNRCSSLQYTAAANTLVAEFSSHVVRAEASGFGNTLSFVNLIISDLPSAVDARSCGGGGAANGDMSWLGTMICMVGIIATDNNMVNC